jgi:hypothetical protein
VPTSSSFRTSAGSWSSITTARAAATARRG